MQGNFDPDISPSDIRPARSGRVGRVGRGGSAEGDLGAAAEWPVLEVMRGAGQYCNRHRGGGEQSPD